MTRLYNWNKIAIKNFMMLNIVLVICAAASLYSLRTIRFDSDWLSLFSQSDSVVVDYRSIPVAAEGERELFASVTSDLKSVKNCISELLNLNHIESVNNFMNNGRLTWIKIRLKPNLDDTQKHDTINRIRITINSTDKNSALTGPLAVLDDFNKNIHSDFNITGIVVFVLISSLLIFVYGFNIVIIYAFCIQIAAMISSLAIFHIFFKSVNMLTATLPCILVGLGVDFIIHSITAAKQTSHTKSSENRLEGELIYEKATTPLFFGALTTAIAFISLSFTDLDGLTSTGILGAISMAMMYLLIMLFVPPATTYFKSKKPIALHRINLPFFEMKEYDDAHKSGSSMVTTTRILVYILVVTAITLTLFAPGVLFEDRVEKLYNSDMPSLKAQRELTKSLGAFPVALFAFIKSNNPEHDLMKLSSDSSLVIPVLDPEKAPIIISKLGQGMWIKLLAKIDPFDRTNMVKIKQNMLGNLSQEAQYNLRITGISVLSHHLNDKLLDGMITAMLCLCLAIIIVTLLLFKRVLYTFAILLILILAAGSTIGIFSLLDIRLSAYTIILFPLFMGIGIDDCLHIVYHKKRTGNIIKANSSAMRAIILTTLTTLLAYGSLIFAANPGFVSMGLAAVTGISSCFILSVYFLPIIINKKQGVTT